MSLFGLFDVVNFLVPNAQCVIRGDVIEWMDERPQPTPEEIEAAWPLAEQAAKAKEVRAERDRLLAFTDWTQVQDAPTDRDAWARYRQELQDVPSQLGFPEDVTWPTLPHVVTGGDTKLTSV